MRLRVGTRPSALALEQTSIAAAALRTAAATHSIELEVEVVAITTKGDERTDTSFAALGTKGIFIAEIQKALLDDRIDLAVHSAKDLASVEPEGLELSAFLERSDPRDVLVSREGLPLAGLPPKAVVGTSSARRQALLRDARPDLTTGPLRGNVDTRLRKVADGEVDAAVLAAAGLVRLGLTDSVTEWLDPAVFVPAPGQGAIAIEASAERLQDDLVWTGAADHAPTRACVEAERTFMRLVEGGCEVPLGGWARYEDGLIRCEGFLAPDGGGPHRRGHATGSDPDHVGADLAQRLLAGG